MSARPPGRRRRIAVVTGTRAEYGLLTSTMQAMQAEPGLKLQLVVTGMHLLRAFGHTVDQIVRDGWHIHARVRMQAGSDGPLDQAVGLSRGVAGIARFLAAAKTDIVLVLGDRIEAMAGALAAVATGRILAHVHGGDVAPGDFDDSFRHAITKLAHVHLAATHAAARRIIRLGESPARVHVVGAVGLDRLREILRAPNTTWSGAGVPARHTRAQRPAPLVLIGALREEHRRPAAAMSGQALIVHHACGRPVTREARTMDAILRAVASLGLRRLIIYPNTDRGHRGVLAAIGQHRRQSPPADVTVLRSLRRDDYLRALIRADVLVGNSSSGIIEAPLAGTPSVNVGPRQAGRQPGGRSILQVGETYAAIRAGIQIALRKRSRPAGPTVYGDGRAGQRIARILAELPAAGKLTPKVITY